MNSESNRISLITLGVDSTRVVFNQFGVFNLGAVLFGDSSVEQDVERDARFRERLQQSYASRQRTNTLRAQHPTRNSGSLQERTRPTG